MGRKHMMAKFGGVAWYNLIETYKPHRAVTDAEGLAAVRALQDDEIALHDLERQCMSVGARARARPLQRP